MVSRVVVEIQLLRQLRELERAMYLGRLYVSLEAAKG